MDQMRAQAEHVGTRMMFDIITGVDFSQRPFVCTADSGDQYIADTVIISTGAQARWLGIPSEETYRGLGVSACATCDGFFSAARRSSLSGAATQPVEEAIYLTNHASKVTLVHRRDTLRAEQIMQDRLFRNPKIFRCLGQRKSTKSSASSDPPRVTGVRIRNLKTQTIGVIPAEGVFVAIGHTPVTEPFRGQITLDGDGYIVTRPDSTATNVAGVFAAGDVKDKVFRQAVTAAGMGCMAALEAEKFLAATEHLGQQHAAE